MFICNKPSIYLSIIIKRDINFKRVACVRTEQEVVVKRQLPITVSSPERTPVVKKALKSSESEAANRSKCNSPVKPVARKTIRPSIFIIVIFLAPTRTM